MKPTLTLTRDKAHHPDLMETKTFQPRCSWRTSPTRAHLLHHQVVVPSHNGKEPKRGNNYTLMIGHSASRHTHPIRMSSSESKPCGSGQTFRTWMPSSSRSTSTLLDMGYGRYCYRVAFTWPPPHSSSVSLYSSRLVSITPKSLPARVHPKS